MAKKRIFTVGFELPGDEFEYIPFGSDQSLLDADIILFEPSFGTHIARETYEGQGLFEQWASHPVSQELGHWRAELAAATNAGKLVIVFLAKPLTHYRYTGEKNFSGTGRSRVTTNMVTLVGSYSAVPNVTSADAKSGREVRLTKDAAYLAAYWSEFGEFSAYEAFVEGKFSHTLITTKAGDKIVGAAVRGKGALLFLPPLRYDEKKFTKYDPKKDQTLWTSEAQQFGKRLVHAIAGLWDALIGGKAATPPPSWASGQEFRTPQEGTLHSQLAAVGEEIADAQERKKRFEQQLRDAGEVRGLLYEQGKPLERAVREALTTLSFSAKAYAESDAEFDVLFESPEGRFLGEVEGKDTKAVNIDKLSQLERNLQEDFAREAVETYAKGVLFGNPERLAPPSERGDPFTAKCLTSAKRAHIALVRTADLFAPVVYLRVSPDQEFARRCREAILSGDGVVVAFPGSPEQVTENASAKSTDGPPGGSDVVPET